MDDSHAPRHICQAREKAKSIRRFVTSPKLKDAISSHCAYLRTLDHDDMMLEDLFVFSGGDHKSRVSQSTLHRQLKQIAEVAGIGQFR